MKGLVVGPFVFTYYVLQSVFFSILQQNVVKKGKKLICRFTFKDKEFLFARLEFTAVSRPTEMRRLLISLNKGIMQRGQATKKFKQKKENSWSNILKLVRQKDRVNFGKILIFYFSVLTVSCLFSKTKKSPMATVCNNLGADLKERSVCKSPTLLWSAAETQPRSQSSSVISFVTSSVRLKSRSVPSLLVLLG